MFETEKKNKQKIGYQKIERIAQLKFFMEKIQRAFQK